MPMNDDELAKFLGIAGHPKAQAVVDAITLGRRAVYDRMAGLETELALWQEGLGPKPEGVLIDTERSTRRRRSWR